MTGALKLMPVVLALGLGQPVGAAPVDPCATLQDLLQQIDEALTRDEAGTPVAQVDMLRIKLAATKAGLGISDASDSWPDPRSKPSVRAVSAAAKGPEGGPFDAVFAAQTLRREGPVLAEGLAAGCPVAALPPRYSAQ